MVLLVKNKIFWILIFLVSIFVSYLFLYKLDITLCGTLGCPPDGWCHKPSNLTCALSTPVEHLIRTHRDSTFNYILTFSITYVLFFGVLSALSLLLIYASRELIIFRKRIIKFLLAASFIASVAFITFIPLRMTVCPPCGPGGLCALGCPVLEKTLFQSYAENLSSRPLAFLGQYFFSITLLALVIFLALFLLVAIVRYIITSLILKQNFLIKERRQILYLIIVTIILYYIWGLKVPIGLCYGGVDFKECHRVIQPFFFHLTDSNSGIYMYSQVYVYYGKFFVFPPLMIFGFLYLLSSSVNYIKKKLNTVESK